MHVVFYSPNYTPKRTIVLFFPATVKKILNMATFNDAPMRGNPLC